jgi:hypothetical protein
MFLLTLIKVYEKKSSDAKKAAKTIPPSQKQVKTREDKKEALDDIVVCLSDHRY